MMKTFTNPLGRFVRAALSAWKTFAGFTFLNAIRRPIACAGLVFLLLAASAAQAQTALPTGEWTLEKCEIRKDSAGRISDVDYRLSEENISRWYIFTTLTFDGKETCHTVLNGDTLTGNYSVTNGDTLKLDFIIMLPEYRYTLKGDTALELTRRHYLYNVDYPERGFLDIKLYYSPSKK
jgi:hypothetical protein